MLLIGRIVQSSSLNSFSSICYCLFTLGVHAYSCYTAIGRYREAESRAWPGGGGTSGPPVESGTMLGLTILSLVLMPLFCFTCVLKVGNLANDGVKLGRDHALGCASDTTKDCSTRSRGLRRLWKIACPVSQTIHVIAAFLILLPETLLTAVEIKYGYKSTGEFINRVSLISGYVHSFGDIKVCV
ncbi:protein tincar [Elysia marginata]|uniref:Protein tincar n=1 Tax=Elysia marginata TaxID=1093978 RepID=A0AAV4IF03_9GAST|nr:protein tincar [Elysia marginata]